MNSRRDEASAGARNPIFERVAAGRRRDILRYLLGHDSPVTDRDVATHLATKAQEPAVQAVHSELVHVHLPALADTGLIEWTRTDETIDTAAHPALDDPRFRLLLEVEADGLDDALSNLADERRRVLLTVLRDARTSLTRTDLARELLRSEETDLVPDSESVDDVLVSLHHVHLPALVDAGLVEYDRETDRISYAAHPALEEVFTIIYEPDERLVGTYDGFLEGLKAAYEKWSREPTEEADWPHFWREFSHG